LKETVSNFATVIKLKRDELVNNTTKPYQTRLSNTEKQLPTNDIFKVDLVSYDEHTV